MRTLAIYRTPDASVWKSSISWHPTKRTVLIMIKFIYISGFCMDGRRWWFIALWNNLSANDLFGINLTGHTLQPDHEIQLFTGIQPHSDGSIFNRFMEAWTCTLEDLISYLTLCWFFHSSVTSLSPITTGCYLSKGKFHQFYTLKCFFSSWEFECICEKVIWSLLWLQRKLHVIW